MIELTDYQKGWLSQHWESMVIGFEKLDYGFLRSLEDAASYKQAFGMTFLNVAYEHGQTYLAQHPEGFSPPVDGTPQPAESIDAIEVDRGEDTI